MADPYSQHGYSGQRGSTGDVSRAYGQQQQYPQRFSQGYAEDPPSTSYHGHAGQQSYAPAGTAYGSQGAYYQTPPQRPPQGQSYGQAQGFGQGFGGGGVVPDAVSDLAAGVFRQQGENYFQRGQAYVQSKMGFLSSGNLQYHFDIDTGYVRDKLFLLLLPFLKQWSFSRKPEQISGGHRYQPPRQDTFAPDLYIPFMAACTYVVLVSAAQTLAGKFTHDNVYVTVSGTFTAWFLHWLVIKLVLYLLGVPSAVPFLENVAYAGYPFIYACLGLAANMAGGLWPYRAVLAYGGLAMGTFVVRTMKHVLFHDSHFSGHARLNYVLLGLALFQFPFLAWFYVDP